MRRLSFVTVGVLVIAFCWRVVSVQQTVPPARRFHDTQFYFEVARSPVWSLEFWAGARSPLPALLFKACALQPERIRFWLLIISISSWSAFALALSRSIKAPGLKPVAVALALSLGASRTVAQWNHALLSESLSFSLAVVCLASALMFMNRPKIWLAPTIGCALAFALCRDSNAYLILMIGAFATMLAAFRVAQKRAWWRAGALGLAFVSIFPIVNASANAGSRWVYPLTNVVVERVLPDSPRWEAFEAEGMPKLRHLKPRRPRHAYDKDRSLAPFRSWIAEHGKQAYERFLLSSPRYLFTEANLADLLSGDVQRYAPPGMRDNLPELMESFWSRRVWWIHLIAALTLTLLCICIPAARRGYLTPIGICLSVLIIPHALLIWHGDSMETARHEIEAVFQMQISLVLLLPALADSLLAARISPSEKRIEPTA